MDQFISRIACSLIISVALFSSCQSETTEKGKTALTPSQEIKTRSKSLSTDGMVLIPAGEYEMGGDSEQADADEFPKHSIQIDSFWMDETEVTNAQFSAFVAATGYVTVAERPINWEDIKKDLPPGTPKPPDSILQPGALVFTPTSQPINIKAPGAEQQWWRWQIGANWRHPEGAKSSIEGKENYPVVQIAWEDAATYAKWSGKRLPTEAEWEWAARGGLENNIYPWGNEDVNKGKPKANFWQGVFPYQNTEKDGFFGLAPVKFFEPNGYGLYDMAGNAWEWCADWYKNDFYKEKAAFNLKHSTGPNSSFDPNEPYAAKKSMRGGSFLCNDDYCSGYRVARRMKSSPDTGLNHTGFRCVADASQ